MCFNAIRENKILAKISEITVLKLRIIYFIMCFLISRIEAEA